MTTDRHARPSPKQRAILDFVLDTVADRGAAPTLREIMARFGIASTNGVACHLDALERKGLVRLRPGATHGIEVVGLGPYLRDAVAAFRRDAAGGAA